MLRPAGIFVACMLLIGIKPGQAQKKVTDKMSDVMAVEFQSEEPCPLHGPVPVLVTLTNVTPQPIQVLLPYPNPNNLEFRSLTQGFAPTKVVEPELIERTVPITVEPGRN